jgi:lambda repressor-like predicted transcriptional regulator
VNIGDILKDTNKAKKFLEKLIIEKGDKKLAEILIPLVKDPYLTYRYAKDIVKGKIKEEWEDIIAQNSNVSRDYAIEVLKGPFPKGEDAIAQDPYSAYQYARYALHKPFPKGEDAIANSAALSLYYAKYVLHDRFPKGEKTIINSKIDPTTSDLLSEDEPGLDAYVEFLKSIGKLDEFLKDHPEVKI